MSLGSFVDNSGCIECEVHHFGRPVLSFSRHALSVPKLSLRPPITVVLTFEGLATCSLSAYGCSWNETPAIDTLASGGVTWDRWTSPIDHPRGLIRQWLADSRATVQGQVESKQALFLTDDPALSLDRDAFGFSKTILLKPNCRDAAADAIESTALAQVFASTIDAIEPRTSLIWLHSNLLSKIWDAPVPGDENDLGEDSAATGVHDDQTEDISGEEETSAPDSIERAASEGDLHDPEPFRLPPTVEPPTLELAESDDPDLLFAWMNRYAAQVRLLDQMIGVLGDSLRNRNPAILLAGTSGFSMGENGWIGHRVGPLRSPDLRLPMLVSTGGPLRVPSVQSAKEFSEILRRVVTRETIVSADQWCTQDDSFSPLIRTDSDRASEAITTPTWFYVRDLDDPTTGRSHAAEERLFLKPDDINDVNDISRLRLDVIDQLTSHDA